MRVIVTGGAGFVGSHIVDRLLVLGHEVLVIDDLSTGKRDNVPRDADLRELDIRDHRLLEVVSSFGPDVVTHCAAQKSVPASVIDPESDASTNILGGINVCQAAIGSGAIQFIYVTTGGALYGQPCYLPLDEDHPINPESGYGLSKWTAECYLQLLLPESMDLKVLRLGNVYGPRQDPDGEAGVVAIFAQHMICGQQITIFGDGDQTRDFIFVEDVAKAYDIALETFGAFVVNIGTGIGTTINELTRIMMEQTGAIQPPVYLVERSGDIKHVVLGNARAQKILGWKPNTALEVGLRHTIDWFMSQDLTLSRR